MIWTGAWQRPLNYGDAAAEVRAVHETVGVIDVSTLGKLLVAGPDAAAFLERLYPNRFADLAVGRIRYGVLTTDARPDHGRRHGRPARRRPLLRHDDVDRRRRRAASGSSGGTRSGGMDVEIVNVTGALAAVNLAGPRSRELLAAADRAPTSPHEALRYLDAREAARWPACRACCCGSASSASSATSCTSRARTPSTSGTRSSSAAPSAVRARGAADPPAREGSTSSSARTPTPSRTCSTRTCRGSLKLDKDDFVGKWALEHMQERGPRERLVGFRWRALRCRPRARRWSRRPARGPRDERPPERAARQDDRPRVAARPTWPRRARASRSASTAGSSRRACGWGRSSTPKASGCGRDASPSSRRPPRVPSGFEPVGVAARRALAGAEGIDDLSLLGKLEVRGPAVGALDGVEVLQLTPVRALVVGPPERCAELLAALPGFVLDVSAALAAIAVEGDDADAPPHRSRPRRRSRPRASSAACRRSSRAAAARTGSSSRRSSATRSSRRSATRRRGSREGHLPRPPHVAPAGRAEEALRRRHHRRRLARPRDRVLPRQAPRHHATSPCSRRATSARAPPGRNTTIIRANYRTPEGAALLQRERQALRGARRRPRLQPAVLAARPPHARALRAVARDDDRARRGQPAARHRQPR